MTLNTREIALNLNTNANAKRVSMKMMGESERRNMQQVPAVDPASAIAKRIRHLRETCGLSRPKFSAILGYMPMTTLKNYELGYREPGIQVIQWIAAVFGNDVLAWVITGNGGIKEEDVKAAVEKFKIRHIVG